MYLYIIGIRLDNIVFFDNVFFLFLILIIEDVVGCGVWFRFGEIFLCCNYWMVVELFIGYKLCFLNLLWMVVINIGILIYRYLLF